MQIAFVQCGRTVRSGSRSGKFLRMCGSEALIELDNGKRVMWSGASEVELLEDYEEVRVNVLPRLEAELTRLENFTEGKYAKLGITADTPCAELPPQLHSVFVTAAIGDRPEGAILCRRCTTRLCVRADHLFWGTRSDCQRDMVLRGLSRPSGKQVTLEELALRIVRLRQRITRERAKC